ncbi:UNVERIFIED_CONTAM: hypothetical protein FKN15_028492 [Acipenser sinensis]
MLSVEKDGFINEAKAKRGSQLNNPRFEQIKFCPLKRSAIEMEEMDREAVATAVQELALPDPEGPNGVPEYEEDELLEHAGGVDEDGSGRYI